ncbi:MAG: hypothetical protein ACJ8BF_00585 [Gemmatimonadales bacterium]
MYGRPRLPSGVKQLLLWSAPLAWLGCGGGGGTDIVLPSLSITTVTTGVELDPDGYNALVDGHQAKAIGPDETVIVDQLTDGQHTVELSGLAANCVAAENPRSVSVSTGETTTANFAISCGPTSGSIIATTTTTGDGSDPDGFGLTLDGAELAAIGANATLNVTGVMPGAHLLGLSGLAGNCQITGDNPRSLIVAPGQASISTFAVTCSVPAPHAGTIQFTAATLGSSLDDDGYTVTIDGGSPQTLSPNGSVTVGGVAPGSHSVQLGGVATNCTVSGANPRSVSVIGDQTAAVAFSITCVAPPAGVGSIQITAATTGTSLDDSYSVAVDGGNPQALIANGSVTVGSLIPGSHSVLIAGVAANCTVSGANPRSVSVTADQTATVPFTIGCVAPPANTGSVRITATTTGSNPDGDGYTFSVDGGIGLPLGSNGNVKVDNLTPGAHSVALAGVATNCTVSGNNPQSVTIVAGQTGKVSFAVSCIATGSSLNFRISTVYITQSTQTLGNGVPLVADKAAYLRVFVVGNQSGGSKPAVEVTFQNGASVTRRTINPPAGAMPTTLQEGTLGSSWNLPLEASLIRPGLSLSAKVDPANLIPETDEGDNTFPTAGGFQNLTVNPAPLAKIRFVPIQQGNGAPGNVTNTDRFLELARRIYPLKDIDTDIHAVYQVPAGQLQSDGRGWAQLVTDLDGVRVAEGSDRTYYGVANLGYEFGVVGIGLLGWPTAMGTDNPSDIGWVTAHELGHTWNQMHTPCGLATSDSTIDRNYPYGYGIGVYGLDVATQSLKAPSTPDIMGYCDSPWISDYIYRRVMNYRAATAAVVTAAATAGRQSALLVWGRIINGQPVLEPAFRVVTRPQLPDRPGPYSVEGVGTDGASLFRLSFQAAEIADDPSGSRHFAFAVPLDQLRAARLGSLRVSGPGGAAAVASLSVAGLAQAAAPDSIIMRRETDGVELEWNPATHRMIMVRDPDTGQVLAFARGGKARVRTSKRSLDLVASDGVQSRTMRVIPR